MLPIMATKARLPLQKAYLNHPIKIGRILSRISVSELKANVKCRNIQYINAVGFPGRHQDLLEMHAYAPLTK